MTRERSSASRRCSRRRKLPIVPPPPRNLRSKCRQAGSRRKASRPARQYRDSRRLPPRASAVVPVPQKAGWRTPAGFLSSLVLFLVARGDDAQDLLLVGPDQPPHVDQHDGPEPGADSDRVIRFVQEEKRLEEMLAQQRCA